MRDDDEVIRLIDAEKERNPDFRDWVAESDDAYLDIAKRLSGDLAALKRLRTTLRPALAASVVCDPVRYCRAVEDAYREMWRRYCRDVA